MAHRGAVLRTAAAVGMEIPNTYHVSGRRLGYKSLHVSQRMTVQINSMKYSIAKIKAKFIAQYFPILRWTVT